jgi:hypothetical protein
MLKLFHIYPGKKIDFLAINTLEIHTDAQAKGFIVRFQLCWMISFHVPVTHCNSKSILSKRAGAFQNRVALIPQSAFPWGFGRVSSGFKTLVRHGHASTLNNCKTYVKYRYLLPEIELRGEVLGG